MKTIKKFINTPMDGKVYLLYEAMIFGVYFLGLFIGIPRGIASILPRIADFFVGWRRFASLRDSNKEGLMFVVGSYASQFSYLYLSRYADLGMMEITAYAMQVIFWGLVGYAIFGNSRRNSEPTENRWTLPWDK